MKTAYRSPRIDRSYLDRVAEEVAALRELAPDITTDRHRLPVEAGTPVVPARHRLPPIGPRDLSVVEVRHPDIARAISLLWGHPEMNEYFARLWLADGNHGPIDPDAMSELMLLARLHQAVVPQFPGRSLAAILGSDRMYDPAAEERNPWSAIPPRR